MSKLISELKDDDIVYVVEEWHYRGKNGEIENRILEAKIHIKIDEWPPTLDGYIHKHIKGVLYFNPNRTKITNGDFQVFRISTLIPSTPGKKLTKKEFDKQRESPGGIWYTEFDEYLKSSYFAFMDHFRVFTDKEDAKNYIVDFKLNALRKEFSKGIRVCKYKEKKS